MSNSYETLFSGAVGGATITLDWRVSVPVGTLVCVFAYADTGTFGIGVGSDAGPLTTYDPGGGVLAYGNVIAAYMVTTSTGAPNVHGGNGSITLSSGNTATQWNVVAMAIQTPHTRLVGHQNQDVGPGDLESSVTVDDAGNSLVVYGMEYGPPGTAGSSGSYTDTGVTHVESGATAAGFFRGPQIANGVVMEVGFGDVTGGPHTTTFVDFVKHRTDSPAGKTVTLIFGPPLQPIALETTVGAGNIFEAAPDHAVDGPVGQGGALTIHTGQAVAVAFRFAPGNPDLASWQVDWGDGTTTVGGWDVYTSHAYYDIGNVANVLSSSVIHSYDTIGNYPIRVTVWDTNGDAHTTFGGVAPGVNVAVGSALSLGVSVMRMVAPHHAHAEVEVTGGSGWYDIFYYWDIVDELSLPTFPGDRHTITGDTDSIDHVWSAGAFEDFTSDHTLLAMAVYAQDKTTDEVTPPQYFPIPLPHPTATITPTTHGTAPIALTMTVADSEGTEWTGPAVQYSYFWFDLTADEADTTSPVDTHIFNVAATGYPYCRISYSSGYYCFTAPDTFINIASSLPNLAAVPGAIAAGFYG